MLEENVIPPSSRLLRMNGDIDWVTEEEANDILLWLVPQTMAHYEMGPVIAIAEEYRCFEDFDTRASNQKKDFYRKWYHTQTQHPQISLEGSRRITPKNTTVWNGIPKTNRLSSRMNPR